MFYYVYLIRSLKDGSTYIGFTRNTDNRLEYHNSGKNVSTRNKVPWELVYFEAYRVKEDALGREKFLKSGSGRRYLGKQNKHFYLRDSK